ncbi:MAG: AsmA family protein [Nitrosomonas sp.]|nr:AsmA family protein [Nitrosomonas sp.]
MVILKWAGIGLTFFISFLLLVVALINWNWVLDLAARQVSKEIGRALIIDGDLTVNWSQTLHIRMEQIRLENAKWSKHPYMFELAALDLQIDLRALIKGDLIFPQIALYKPSLILEKSFQGKPNWDLPIDLDVKLPIFQRLMIDDSRLVYQDLSTNAAETIVTFSKIRAHAGEKDITKLQAHGNFNKQPLAILLNAGPLLALRKLEKPFPIAVSFKSPGNNVTADKVLIQPLQLKGNLIRQKNIWQFAKMYGQIGKSDLMGNILVDIRRQRRFVEANITSNRINVNDFVSLINFVSKSQSGNVATLAKQQEIKQKESNTVVLPVQPLDFEIFRYIDANINLRVNHVASKVPVNNLIIQMLLDHGHLTLFLPDFGIAKGNIQLRIELDVEKKPVQSKIEAKIRHVKLNEILHNFEFANESLGVIGGQGIFWFKGDSVAEMLASADGGLLMLMAGGKLDALLVELSGLDIGESLVKLLGDRETVKINCVFLDFPTKKGVMNINNLVIDTQDTLYFGKGSIDFAQERLEVVIDPRPKDLSLYSARAPLHITGSFKDPSILPEASAVLRGFASLALLPAAPIVALIGLLPEEYKEHKDMHCSGFANAINEAR